MNDRWLDSTTVKRTCDLGGSLCACLFTSTEISIKILLLPWTTPTFIRSQINRLEFMPQPKPTSLRTITKLQQRTLNSDLSSAPAEHIFYETAKALSKYLVPLEENQHT